MDFHPVTDAAQLDVLREQSAAYGDLTFKYSDEYIEWLASLLNSNHAYQIILKENETFVGYLACAETLWSNHLTILETFISPLYQRRGIGSILIQKAIGFAKDQKLEGIIVQTEHENIPAQKLYEKCGFKKFENEEWEGVSYRLDVKK